MLLLPDQIAACGDRRQRTRDPERDHDDGRNRPKRLPRCKADMAKRRSVDEPARDADQRAEQIPEERHGDEAVGDRGSCSRDERVSERRRPEEQ
jgi:hypothetical protein